MLYSCTHMATVSVKGLSLERKHDGAMDGETDDGVCDVKYPG